MKKWTRLTVQFIVSAGLVAYVLGHIDAGQVKYVITRPGGLPYLLGALVLFNISKMASAIRLNVYQRHADINLSERDNVKLYYAGMFLNQFLPGGIGGDGYKILVLHRNTATPLGKLVTITLADRISGLMNLLVLLCVITPMLPLPWDVDGVGMMALTAGITIIAAFILGHGLILKLKSGAQIATLFGYGMGVQLAQLLCMGMLLAWLRVPTGHWLAYLAVFLVSSVAAVLPISFGGLGAREITFYYFLGSMQLDPTQGIIASSALFLIAMLSSLIGAPYVGRAYGERKAAAH